MAESDDSAFMSHQTVLYCFLNPSSFVQKDIEILECEFELKKQRFDVRKRHKLPLAFLKQLIFLTSNVFSSRIVVIQFAGYQSLIPVIWAKLFRKHSIIILGGTDCVSFPSIAYGNFTYRLLSLFTKYSLKWASMLVPVDQTLVHCRYDYQTNDFAFQGYKQFVKSKTASYQVISNGFKTDQWKKGTKIPRTFATVAADLNTRFGKQLKGIDLIFTVATEFPECTFYIVGGRSISDVEHPENVILMDFIPNHALPDFLGKIEFYLQLSMSEGFPNALCEAMLCGCIPIVSSVGAMPMIVNANGFILNSKDDEKLTQLISIALECENKTELSFNSSESIKKRFPFEKRRSELLNLVHQMLREKI